MDFGFVSGPDNVQDVFYHGATPKTTVVTSRNGHTAYLLIIDAATRYLWVFPVKTKQPPIDLLDTFLTRHGQARQGQAQSGLITTHPNGLLAQSKHITTMLTQKHRHLTLTEHDLQDPLFITMNDCPTYAIRSDNGKELAGSHAFNALVNQHGYLVEPTGPDSSSMNGLAEKPHRTLKERIRCMLWNAGLGVEFWADAIVHATWLYNRSFHTAINQTPYQAYTHRIPTLDNLITFGSKIVAKKAKRRPTTLDPNSYNGLFLGYTATTDIIRYWDIDHQQERTAKHYAYDELHFGNHPANRPPGAKLLLELDTKQPSHQTNLTTLLDTQDPPSHFRDLPSSQLSHRPSHHKYLPPDDPLPYNKQPSNLLGPLPPTAAAARIHAHINKTSYGPLRDQHRLHYDLAQLHMTNNIFEPHVTECLRLPGAHSTLGLICKPHPDLKRNIILDHCLPGTTAAKQLKRWKSRLRYSTLRQVNDTPIHSLDDLQDIITHLRQQGHTTVNVHFALPRWQGLDTRGIPTLGFD